MDRSQPRGAQESLHEAASTGFRQIRSEKSGLARVWAVIHNAGRPLDLREQRAEPESRQPRLP